MPWFHNCSRISHERAPVESRFRLPVKLAHLAQASMATAAFTLAGCHSAHIDATVSNRTATSISLIQVEYPSAAFGTQTLPPGQDFHYRFKVLGSGPIKITYTDASEKEHKSTGPTLEEGSEGTLRVVVTGTDVEWQPKLLGK